MSCIPSAAYRIIRARCTVRNGNVTVDARLSSSERSSAVSSIGIVLGLARHIIPRAHRYPFR